MIRGEYWIVDGEPQFADGDVGDYNHEALAIEHVFGTWSEDVSNLAEEYGIESEDDDYYGYEGIDPEKVTEKINQILEILQEQHSEEDANGILMKQLNINEPAYLVICGFGSAFEYVMMYEGWIAVRGTNADLYGYDEAKRKSLADGIESVFYEEGIPPEQIEEIEIQVSDHKTGNNFYATLEDLKQPQVVVRPQQQPVNTKGDRRFAWTYPDPEENKYSKPVPSTPNPTNAAAQKQKIIGPGQDLWRGTSESVGKFKKWFDLNS